MQEEPLRDTVLSWCSAASRSTRTTQNSLGFAWQEIVTERLYPHVKIVDIKMHTLVLRADHPSWAQITMMQQKRIIGELQRRYPSLEITTIQVIT